MLMNMLPETTVSFQYEPSESIRSEFDIMLEGLERQTGGQRVMGRQGCLTVARYGRVDGMYNQLLNAAPALEPETYLTHLEAFTKEAAETMPQTLDVQLASFTLRGNSNFPRRLMAVVEFSPEIKEVKGNIVQKLGNFLRACGVVDPLDFVENSSNFSSILTVQPYIPLVRTALKYPSTKPPKTLEVKALSPWYDETYDRSTRDTQNSSPQA